MGIQEAAQRLAAAGPSTARVARDPVNRPAIRDWLAAMGDENPVYERDGVAPPARPPRAGGTTARRSRGRH